ncbi:chitin elicitor receptor kinase 1-like isoform X2 [Papaver somniferum]|uniref:chitin elicitor receptor kinase 1-like isoform X2 n=1 Tax=Papaver somniferum TaxID=3469 RepID=UPI000E700535|nr:chitin elicitor receptor kinase 1-like isoform X2 [Papaver somniferum]
MVPIGRRRIIKSKGEIQFKLGFVFWGILFLFSSIGEVECQCRRGCDLALAYYDIWAGTNLTFTSKIFSTSDQEILKYNPQVPNKDLILADDILNVPFRCDCIQEQRLGHNFTYTLQPGDTYEKIVKYYSNLTTKEDLSRDNPSYNPNNILDGSLVNVIVNCSCGDEKVDDYGLFVTYPLLPGDNLSSIAKKFNISSDLLRSYNPKTDFSSGKGVVFFPGKDETGNYPRLKASTGGLPTGAIVGIAVGIVAFALLLAVCTYIVLSKKKKAKKALLLFETSEGSRGNFNKSVELASPTALASPRVTGITVDKSVEFTYEELARATDDFSLANKIGQGGFGAVYYAELRGEKAAIKKMDMQASKEFLAELKVLTRVHHLNLVRLIGYCVEGSLFLVYEFIDSGNLSEHLRGTEKEPLPWSTRVHIALDSARGLEYIHEHTVPVYIHRDIKSANILVDRNFRGKVADFGLTKLTEVGSGSLQTRVVGTFGYMPPEYAQWGDITPKVDVYAFGVVLYELISAKEAVVRSNGSSVESRGLVSMFEEVLNQPESNEDLRKLVDPRLGDNYPFDSIRKVAQLAKACTQENPQLRPSMRSIVVALMTLSSSTEDWDVGSFYENHGLVNLMSGR